MTSNELALQWWNSLTIDRQKRHEKNYSPLVPIVLETKDIVHIWESQGWPDPDEDLGINLQNRCENCQGMVVLHAFSTGSCIHCKEQIDTSHIPCHKVCRKCSNKLKVCEQCNNPLN